MNKNIVLQYKAEKENLLSKKYILRENLVSAKKFVDSDLIKVIIGPRRVGKSIFSLLLLKNKNFAYLNFDDECFSKIENYDEIIESLCEVYPETKYILFDEVQNLENWELFVNKLQRRGYNLTITGSNAKLLSHELSTKLTGRYIAMEIFPFSFKEFLKAKEFKYVKKEIDLPEVKGKLMNLLDEYLKNGGFPEIVVKRIETKKYLETLFDAVLFKDVVKRYKVRFSRDIYNLAVYLIANFCGEFTYTRLKNVLKFRSVKTLQDYLGYLENSYLFFSLNRFSFKISEQIKTSKKIYMADNGFILAKAFTVSQNLSKLLENLVFIELLRREFKINDNIFYYKTKNGREVDFIIKENFEIKKLIQVCYDISREEVKTREMRALSNASAELNCEDLSVITWNYEAESLFKGKKIKFIPLLKWLLRL